jgi:hypothetical protein
MDAVSGQGPDEQNEDVQARQLRYEWRLRELMAVRKNWYTTTKLIPELRKYGFEFDRSSIYRLWRKSMAVTAGDLMTTPQWRSTPPHPSAWPSEG